MAKRIRRNERKEASWRQSVARQAASKLSIRRFCREHDLSEAAFHWWRRELARRDAEQPGKNNHGLRTLPFTEIQMLPEPAAAPAQEWGATARAVEILLEGGRRIGAAPGFDASTPARVPAVLEGTE